MKNKNNNERKIKKNSLKDDNIDKDKNLSKLKQRLNKPGNLIEYFAIIGVDPNIATNNFLFELSPSEISELHSEELKPVLITKYPPIDKSYINLDENNICELCFPEKIKVEQFKNKPKPEIYRYLLTNSFYSIEHPLKYLTCLKFYESFDKYYELNQKILNIKEIKNSSSFRLDNINNYKKYFKEKNKNQKANKSQDTKNRKQNLINPKKIDKNLKNYYLPKIICFVSLKPEFHLHEKILYQLYDYLNIEKIKIPLEKIILNILCNIPNPPRGIHKYQYTMAENFEKINIQAEKMNRIKIIDEDLKKIIGFFKSIDNFLTIFKYTLFETKTTIFSTNVNKIFYLINGLISILFPFNYPFQILSCLMDGFGILESPPPYIIGINQKFDKNFFPNHNIELKSIKILVIDLDTQKFYLNFKEHSPDIPENILKKLKSKIEIALNRNNSNEISEENTISFAFYEFFLNILLNYSNYLNKDNLKKNFKIKNLEILFKTKEFIESHSTSERPFYTELTKTQMFNDFILKKMIPKDITDKLDILLFDENINKINNKKKTFFSRKNSTSFLTSKEYEFKSNHKIPKVKSLLDEELSRYKNKNYYKKNLLKGQEIILEDKDYFFNYIIFPKFNNDFFEFPSNEFFIYFYTVENIINDINRVNTDLLAKSLIDIGDNDSLINDGEEMLDYIYLTYIEVWGYSFWYQDLSERDYRFNQLMEVLDKIKRQEIELFNILFEMLDKFYEKEKLKKLYDKILEYKLTPNSFIYSIVGKNMNENRIGYNIDNLFWGKKEKKNNFQRRTFKSENETTILGNNIHFIYMQECPECGKIINIKTICKDYKKMKKELLWATCPICLMDIKPQLSVILGNDIFPGAKNIALSKTEIFTLYSPYELKNNIKIIISKEQFHLLNIDKLRNSYTNIFWNCIWYFHLYNLDYSIILPYEVNLYKKKASSDAILTPFIITRIAPFLRKKSSIDENQNNKNEIIINDNNNIENNIHNNIVINIDNDNNKINNKINKNNNVIIHNNLSFEYIKGNFFKNKTSLIDMSIESSNISDININNNSFINKFKTFDKNNNINSDEVDKNKIDISKSNLK